MVTQGWAAQLGLQQQEQYRQYTGGCFYPGQVIGASTYNALPPKDNESVTVKHNTKLLLLEEEL